MAGPRTRRNTGGASINDSGTPKSISAVFCASISALAQALALTFASAPAFVSDLPERYTDNNLQKTTKFALELFAKGQEHGQLQASIASCNHPFKAQNSNL